MNVFSFIGNLGKDATVRNAGGTSVAGFSVAAKSGYGDKQQTLWIDCSLWGKPAESRLVDYLKKGQQVAVSGELGTREHEGKTYLTCRISTISLCGKRDDMPAPSQPKPQPADQQQAAGGHAMDDDIPFAPVNGMIA